jgi:choline kinase
MHHDNGDVWYEEKTIRQFISNMSDEITIPVTNYYYKYANRVMHITESRYRSLMRAKKSVEAMTCQQ